MKASMQIELVDEKYLQAATELVISAYREERMTLPYLPQEEDFTDLIPKGLERIFTEGVGVVALDGEEVVGFLVGWEIDDLWGKEKGIYSPLYAHGARKEGRSRIYQEMYRQAADLWVKKGCLCHAATFYPQDQETIETWFWLGFGLRCVDAIREVAPIQIAHPEITIRKAELVDIPKMAHLNARTDAHLNQSPLFMPVDQEDPVEVMLEWFKNENRHLWVAYRGDEPVGYMKIQPRAENFISNHAQVMNITGAYVLEAERGSNVGGLLVAAIQAWLAKEGYPLCGVDFEAFNPEGSRFWKRYFTPYTYSVVRRIDERIIESTGIGR